MTQLILATVIGIASIVVFISVFKLHPFLSLTLGSFVLAVAAGVPYDKAMVGFAKGVGATTSGVGLLIALGAIVGTLLFSSGGADVIVDTIMSKTKIQLLPWAMALVAFIVGIPMFFEVGVVILIPVVLFAARRAKMPVILIGIPALAGLSVLHAFVPPHPGPLIAINSVNANLGLTLGLGLLVSIPVVIICGPIAGKFMAKWVPIEAPIQAGTEDSDLSGKRPSFFTAITVILLPVFLMLGGSIVEMLGYSKTPVGRFLHFLGTPLEALFITAVYAMIVLGYAQGRSREFVNDEVGKSFASIASILLIVAAGGGLKQILVDSGIDKVIANAISGSNMNLMLAGWLVAVLIRLATGSATVATITSGGIMAPLAANMSQTHLALLVLAIGAGSVFLSHLNDAGFWLVKEYFGMTISQTFKTWSLMETLVSVVGLVVVWSLSLVI
ncbi:GntP family permease [Actinotignum urinale]|uniref:Gluconate:H+ symporter n=1 Tax=Actinotignum urinale TaxID=190146 RepID=A0ABU5G5J5_9ACTO|nr:gluconate:H+ symporter [Actinotignum urinale]MDY5132466.1 gluconate:H+ symporter [Actinotignum urinale]MDY5159927.1 gluconate:H+ symporter [Actinotignum urinale]WIK58672.1 gluconate:H+ symporter [Actinotignum urinale]